MKQYFADGLSSYAVGTFATGQAIQGTLIAALNARVGSFATGQRTPNR